MRLVVLDTETSGDGPDDQVVEAATETLDERGALLGRRSSLFRPTVPVQPEARAAHHLADEELAEAPALGALAEIVAEWDEEDVLVAHNVEFDVRMMAQSLRSSDRADWAEWLVGARRVCTMRCAKHLWPAAPRFGLQVLRYWLELAPEFPPGMSSPHRASYDTAVCSALLRRMLEENSVGQLVGLTLKVPLQLTCHIGQWRGRPWAEVDAGMLRWILARDFDEEVAATARHWLNERSAR
jgi:exodeoxyribonuclease X